MKNTVFLALAFAAIAVHAQRTYPECLLADCVNFLTITVGCGYSNTNVDITAAQLSCICGAPKGPAEYENCATCMSLDPTNTVDYSAGCPGSGTPSSGSTTTSRTSVSPNPSSTRPPSSGSSTEQPTRAPASTTAGGSLQGFGGCPNGNCGGGDSTRANIYDVSKDSNVVSGAAGAVERGRGMWYGTGAGLAMLVGLVWL